MTVFWNFVKWYLNLLNRCVGV
uniref:Uncharacterized protein n=1 Tax=Anguilla anguilla TaxID=7936 RepID=A0A0E9QSB6_ANGAN